MSENLLEETISKYKLKASDISNLSDSQLDEIIDGQEQRTTSEQLKEANARVKTAKKEAKVDYLQTNTGLVGKVKSILYDLGLKSPEKELQKKNEVILKIKAELDVDIKNAKSVIQEGYEEIVLSEKKKLAMDVKIGRKELALAQEEQEYREISNSLTDENLEAGQYSELECGLQESHMNQFMLKNEVKALKADYVLTHKNNNRLKNVLRSQELETQRLLQTQYDLKSQTEEIRILTKRGVNPTKVLSYMDRAYSNIEALERIKNSILKNSYNISEAISDVRIVAGKAADENQLLYKKNSDLSIKINDGFELEYDRIKETSRR